MKHCSSKKRFILLLDEPNGSQIVDRLYDGAWIGVMEDTGDWLRVITSNGYGWIQSVQARCSGTGFRLRVLPGASKSPGVAR